jgi:HAD superfamily hydrolase (TIGR01509 family)
MFSVILDMDGTLLDTQQICIPAWDYAGELQGFSDMGRCIPDVCGANREGWSKYLSDNFKGLDVYRFNKEMREYIIKNLVVRFKPGAEELLKFLRENHIKTALASGSSRESIMHHLREVDAVDSFDVILGGQDVKMGKPAPDIFLLAAGKMGVSPSDCFVCFSSGVNSASGTSTSAVCP